MPGIVETHQPAKQRTAQVTCHPNNEFTCNDGKCITTSWVCDGQNDCIDGSDEGSHCLTKTCTPDEFSCGNGVCIKRDYVCDQVDDCGNSADERNCTKVATCSPQQFTCNNSHCINSAWRCDNDNDCGDNSDEWNCPNKTCGPELFQCSSGDCIKKSWLCDGERDCTDGSDEKNCSTSRPKHTCRAGEFQCKNWECIKSEWRCDGSTDCTDGSDELGCNKTTCKSGQFRCSAHICIDAHNVCDGISDCANSRDEQNCTTPTPPNLTCNSSQFTCHTNKSCISMKLVCNGKFDCEDKSDEPATCNINECSEYNGHCSQNCVNTKVGYYCACNPGYTLDTDGRTCLDINECNISNPCSQMCENTKGSYKCTCADGYRLDADFKSCKALGPEPVLFFANRRDIHRFTIKGSRYNDVMKGLKGAIGIDVHVRKRLLFWTDIVSEKIGRVTLHSNGTVAGKNKYIISDGVLSPECVAVDWIHDTIYWTDTGLDAIKMSDLDGRYVKTIISNIADPRGLAVDPVDGYIYFTDWGSSAKIERAKLDGTQRQILVSTNVEWPNGLTIDYPQRKMYWVDGKHHHIESANLDGSGRRVILSKGIPHPFSITVFENSVYWTDWESKTVETANKLTGANRSVLLSDLYAPMGITTFQLQRQPRHYDACHLNKGGCSQICVKTGDYKRTCLCKDGWQLDSDGTGCVLLPTQSYNCKSIDCGYGSCLINSTNGVPYCSCSVGYGGDNCTVITSASTGEAMTIGVAAGCAIGFLIIIIIIGYIVRRRHGKNKKTFDEFDIQSMTNRAMINETTEDISKRPVNNSRPVSLAISNGNFSYSSRQHLVGSRFSMVSSQSVATQV
ncbi:Low-density lipoprotein receptor-related protein 4 [Trichoplax sp. H2]|nr:Low-density lipoprotein receptor-related protein 4 [Trichoplax sp. H2]|eukprot:RDD47933.1 Low-density lipoprotein receptor-related protein 4 [Trichoplax sp. H2]